MLVKNSAYIKQGVTPPSCIREMISADIIANPKVSPISLMKKGTEITEVQYGNFMSSQNAPNIYTASKR